MGLQKSQLAYFKKKIIGTFKLYQQSEGFFE
jgi:hypothetical protein